MDLCDFAVKSTRVDMETDHDDHVPKTEVPIINGLGLGQQDQEVVQQLTQSKQEWQLPSQRFDWPNTISTPSEKSCCLCPKYDRCK